MSPAREAGQKVKISKERGEKKPWELVGTAESQRPYKAASRMSQRYHKVPRPARVKATSNRHRWRPDSPRANPDSAVEKLCQEVERVIFRLVLLLILLIEVAGFILWLLTHSPGAVLLGIGG